MNRYGMVDVYIRFDGLTANNDFNEAINYLYLLEAKIGEELPELREKIKKKCGLNDNDIIHYESLSDESVANKLKYKTEVYMGELDEYDIKNYFDLIDESEAEDYVDFDRVEYLVREEIKEEVHTTLFDDLLGFRIRSLEDDIKFDIIKEYLSKTFKSLRIKDVEEKFKIDDFIYNS